MTKRVWKIMFGFSVHSQGGTMDRIWRLSIRISVLAAALLVTSCAATPSDVPGSASSTLTTSGIAATPPGALTSSGSNIRVPATSDPPQESCAAFLPTAPCATYGGVAATSNGKALPWAAVGTTKVRLTSVEGTLQLVMKTYCSPIGGPVTIAGNIMTIGKIATGASGCIGTGGEHQAWIHEFLKRPIAMTYTQDTLTWSSGTDTLRFKAE